MTTAYPHVDVTGEWAKLNEQLVSLVDYVPDDKMNWSPKPGLWNFRGILIHIGNARQNWLRDAVKDVKPWPDALREGQTRDGLKQLFRSSWERLERFLSDPAKLDATYERVFSGGEYGGRSFTGHWIAYHLLEHDVHHRADLFHYLALLDIEHPEVETP